MPQDKPMGRLSDMMRRLLMRRAVISACEDIAGSFRLLTFEGAALRNVTWIPGQKVQLAMAAPFVTRTYTPIEWDAAAGRTRILCYMHGDGPGSDWALNAMPGDMCDIFGPRTSLDARSMTGSVAIFGDETSIGLTRALLRENSTRSCHAYLEVSDTKDCGHVIGKLAIENVSLFQRQGQDVHLERIEAIIPDIAAETSGFILSGRASFIQRLQRSLKLLDIPSGRIASKAYWAPGKRGLD